MNRELKSLRALMKKKNIDILIHFNTDPHGSEYISDHHREIEFISGFTGSNATIVVTNSDAGLWTDGRYFIQAENELKGSGFKLYKMNTEDPSHTDFIKSMSKKRVRLGLDFSLISIEEFKKYEDIVTPLKGEIVNVSLIDEIWKDRPNLPANKAFLLDEQYSGKSSHKKVKELRKFIKETGSDGMIINELCDIAWLLNIRSSDIPYVPVMYAYLYVSMKEVWVFTEPKVLSDNIKRALRENLENVHFFYLNEVYEKLSELRDKSLLIDKSIVNMAILNSLSNARIIYENYPIELSRAKKNRGEIKNTIDAHIDEGVVITKLIYKLKVLSSGKGSMPRELDISKKLCNLRKRVPDYISDSFETISAYGANAAMMHYAPAKGGDIRLKRKGFLLVDTGGHYLRGTTDTTRTIALGPISDKEKHYYTKVLKAHLNLMGAKFPKGATGLTLDVLSRNYFWQDGEDYLSGTGHGVGHILSVHEGPNGIRWRYTTKPNPIEPGMITTDEPGFYEENEFGIRIENELLCVPHSTTEYGKFYRFRPITLAPYEMDAINISELTDFEKDMLNRYNRLVYKSLKDYLTDNEKTWLYNVTRPV